jgi:hypothetical protein
MKLYQYQKDYIYSQLENFHSEKECQVILKIFEVMYNLGQRLSMTSVEVIEETANINHLGDKIPYWLYNVIPYEDFCNYIESLDVIQLGEDFIKLDEGIYFEISDIVNFVYGSK